MSVDKIRQHPGIHVANYIKLYEYIAELHYNNPGFFLLFRGQSNDYFDDKGRTSLLPTIFRYDHHRDWYDALEENMQSLQSNERSIIETAERLYDPEYLRMIKKAKVFQWAIIQHYELCGTPLLDVTQSIRVAASFACDNTARREVYIYVIAVPDISGSITTDIDSGIQIVRLSSACHPKALRPHIQEGYLIGEFPDIDRVEQKLMYPLKEVDLGNRLLAKFCFDPNDFFDGSFKKIEHDELYPNSIDHFFGLIETYRHR